MKIGLLLKKPESVFSNGCIQQSLFLKHTLINCGYDVKLFSIEEDYTKFQFTEEDIIHTDDSFDFSGIDILVLASLTLTYEGNRAYIEHLKSFNNLKIVNFICGNVYILHQEEFVFDVHNIIHHYTVDYYHETWILEMYDYMKDYIQLLTKRPVFVTPYIWGPDIVQRYITDSHLTGSFDTMSECDKSKVNLLIFEPNMSIHKNALIPLLIAENYYNQFKDNVNKIYVFCGEKISNESKNLKLFQSLEIIKDKRVEIYGRIVMPHILTKIRENNNYLNIVLSHNVMNKLNFIHLELFHLGIPIVHNCEPYATNGMYYADGNETKAVQLIEDVRLTFETKAYKEITVKLMDNYHYTNQSIIDSYVEVCEKKNDRVRISDTCDEPHTEPTVAPKVFRRGTGYLIIVDDVFDDVHILKMLNKIKLKHEIMDVEIVYTDSLPFHKLPFFMSLNIQQISVSELGGMEPNEQNLHEYVVGRCSFKNVFIMNTGDDTIVSKKR
jgi:hypothetical protein